MDKEILKKVAKAAHIALSEEEIERFGKDLGSVLENFDIIDEVPDAAGYTLNSIDIADILREDVAGIFVDPDILLKDMKTYENYVRGPRLL